MKGLCLALEPYSCDNGDVLTLTTRERAGTRITATTPEIVARAALAAGRLT